MFSGFRDLAKVLAAVVVLAAALPVSATTTRGLEIKARDTGQTVALYAESHALIIGVSDYDNGWPPLRGVKEDVPAVKAALEKQGFQVEVVMDPDRRQLDDAFRSFINRYGLRADNRLLFYFAGHGHSMKLGYGGMMGYLVGRDAPNPNVDRAGFLDRALSMQVIETYAKNIESKHALFMFDACFAGSVFDATRAIPEVIAEKTGRPVREFITSGTADQQVPDTSIFRRQFVAALAGEGDLDRDGYVTGAELGQFLEAKVTNYSHRTQTPQYGKLRDPLLDKGDFVFVLPSGHATGAMGGASSVPSSGGADATVWATIQNSNNAVDFRTFLATFPNSPFAAFARARLDALGGTQTASLPPATASAGGTPSGPTPADIREVQTLLSGLGYSPGSADGVMGTNTRTAIESFQRSHGMSADGEVSDGLLGSLRAARAQVAVVTPAPAPAPQVPAVQAPALAPGAVFRDCIGGAGALVASAGRALPSGASFCGPEMVVVPGGSFEMGDLDGSGDSYEKPVHRVTIPRPFAVGKYEVTQAEWVALMGSNPSQFKGDRNPVEQVSWNDLQDFVKRLSAKTGKSYRLLSEAEWEYAARAGSRTKYPWGDGIDPSKANYDTGSTRPIGSYGANAFGLYDTVGNVWEWVEDCYHDSYSGAPSDGSAWTTGSCAFRVLRGGSWNDGPGRVRSAYRNWFNPVVRFYSLGFRVARTL